MPPEQPTDWNRLWSQARPAGSAVDSRVRLWWCLAAFVLLLCVVFGRVVQLEVTGGEAFRREAGRPVVERESLPAARGRILARDGTVLAADKPVVALAVRYRYLQTPPDARWLRSMARSRLSRADRRDAGRVAAEENRIRLECQDMGRRLAELCGLAPAEWSRRAAEIQPRVERIAQSVQRRQPRPAPRGGLGGWLDRWLGPQEAAPPRVIVREELDYHVVVEDVPPAVVAQIRPELFPGARILDRRRRDYPGKTLAAHVLGHLGPVEAEEIQPDVPDGYEKDDLCGRMGLERQYEEWLRGRRGEQVETLNGSGRILSTVRSREPRVGQDLTLTLDVRLQRQAELLLDRALVRRRLMGAEPKEAGGAIVVLDVRTGEILVAACAPRFDPGAMASGSKDQVRRMLEDPAKPFFDRVCRMAIPPGSVFKVVTAVALLESGGLDPAATFRCQGYLGSPQAMRCQVYVQSGRGHGDVTLADALGESCNVYFFHHAAAMGPGPLVDWARRLGFGQPTGVDLPDEAAGGLPSPEDRVAGKKRAWQTADTQMLAIGQGGLTATPLQVARLMAAVANGGKLVTPRLVSRPGPSEPPPRRPIEGLRPETLAAIRAGLRQTVASPEGTAHDTVALDAVDVAGKTGTAQTGGGQADHAWFAGYVPAERPKYALVVVLEHGGDAGAAAGPVARALIEQLVLLGLLW